jgi:hypothetical protein
MREGNKYAPYSDRRSELNVDNYVYYDSLMIDVASLHVEVVALSKMTNFQLVSGVGGLLSYVSLM